MKKRLVVGLSGASGAILCVSLLEAMRREKDWEVHLVTSEAGERVLHEETGMSGTDLAGLAFRTHDIGNIGAAIAIAGVVLVVLNGQMSFHLNPLGDLIALAAALMWAVYSILIKKYTEQYDNFLVTRRVMLWAFLTSLPLMLLTDGMPDLRPLFTTPSMLLSWLFLGVFGNAVCFAIWNIAFQRLGVVITNNYLYASPFVTLVVGFLLLDEQITVMSVVGAVLITAGVIVALKKPAGEKAADV